MRLPPHPQSPLATGLLVVVVSAALLFGEFYLNLAGVVQERWFGLHQKDMESFILGRLVKSRQDGLLSESGLPGYGTPTELEKGFSMDVLGLQYQAYLRNGELAGFTRYTSQIGGQGLLLGVLDRLMPLPPLTKLKCFYALTSVLGALVLASMILWFQLEFGLFVALVVLVTAAGSQWLVVFGRNLWWSTWAFFVPVAVVLHLLRASGAAVSSKWLGSAVFVAAFLKCLFNGYEYITTALIMALVPFVYYGVLGPEPYRVMARKCTVAAASASAAVLLSLVILVFQVASVTGAPSEGVQHLVSALQKRSHADPDAFPEEFRSSLEADALPVVATYLRGAYFDVRRTAWGADAGRLGWSWFPMRIGYDALILVFLAASCVVLWRAGRGDDRRRALALVAATWFAVLAPLSWFVIFKAHSHVHTHMNFLVWQMPFTLFGFSVCADAGRRLWVSLPGRRMKLTGPPATSAGSHPDDPPCC